MHNIKDEINYTLFIMKNEMIIMFQYSDHDSFQDFILLLKSIQFFFETVLEHNKFIGYFDYIG